MEVIVDSVIYQLQSRGGISRLYSEILPRMCEMDDSLRITLLTRPALVQPLPTHRQINLCTPPVERYLRPSRLWKPIMPQVKQLVKRWQLGQTKNKIWHSTYYTMLEGWRGRSVVTVPDMIHELFADQFDEPYNIQLRELKKLSIMNADAVIAISHTTREDMRRMYGLEPDRIHVVHLAASDEFRLVNNPELLCHQIMEPFLLYVGSRAHYKDFGGLVRAFSIWPFRKEIDLVVVGPEWSEEETRILERLDIRDRVRLLADISDGVLCSLYNRAVALVYPSFHEGFGIPLLEAMRCGCPIVASRIPSTLEIAGDCPIYFEPGDVDGLLEALNRALSEGRESDRVRNGFEWAEQYSWDSTAAGTLEVYRSVMT